MLAHLLLVVVCVQKVEIGDCEYNYCLLYFYAIFIEIILPDVPQITLGPSPAFLNLFDPVNFTCTSTGIPTPIIRWFKDGVQLSSGHIVGQNLVFQETKVTDRGFYHCEAENSIGRAESAKVVLNFKSKLSAVAYWLPVFVRYCAVRCYIKHTT